MGETHPTPAEQTSPTSHLVEGREVDPAVLAGDIDSRMAALLKDHQEMGARPAQEPQNTDLFPASQPLNQSTTRTAKPSATASAKKPTTKKAAAKK